VHGGSCGCLAYGVTAGAAEGGALAGGAVGVAAHEKGHKADRGLGFHGALGLRW
jgi:hypothetical protein